jgi:molybdopterin synthase catalytic subunit
VAALTDGPIAIEPLMGEAARPECGAIAIFAGTTRDHHEGRKVVRLSYEAYRPMALEALARIEQRTVERFGVAFCRIVHRLGDVPPAEASVVVVVAAGHRGAAFDACRWAMSEVKGSAPIWKKEHYADGGEGWVQGARLELS